MPTRDRRPVTAPLVLRGSLTTFRRRCGKPTCRCVTGEPHESPALTYSDGGRTKTVTLTGADLSEVRAALARYETARAELDRAADAGLAAVRVQAAAGRRRRPA
jgi:hypothetical protein